MSLVSSIVERIINTAGREQPADILLRLELKKQTELLPAEMTQVTREVFAYFRWLGWLDSNQPLASRVRDALELSERFAKDPASFSDADLLARAVPEWVKSELPPTADWARSLQAEPRLWLRARPGQGATLAAMLGDCQPFDAGALGEILEYRGQKDLFRTKEFHAGSFELQDINSQAVGLLCAPQPGQTWWDACAGEGGKTMHLSDLMQNKGLIWASDRAAWRLQILKRRAARARVFNYRSVQWDGGAKPPTKTKFDGVLVDAPCSGLGTWQRNPHARWTTTPQDVRELSALQLQILRNASGNVKPGGKLIYAVCTLPQAETAGVVAEFEKQCPDFQPLPVQNPFNPNAPASTPIQLWPQLNGGNGMFIALWKRT